MFAFGCVYLFWGSTYVAIRFGVEAINPFVLASTRYLIAGPLMLGLCALRGVPLRQSPRDLWMLAAIGILMLGFGNTALVWAEQYLSSGLSSLLFAVVPIFVALFEYWLPRGEALNGRGWAGISAGFVGLIVLLWPALREGSHGTGHQLAGSAIAIASAFAWTCGSILSRRAKLRASAFVAAGWEMLFAGFFNTLLMFSAGQSFKGVWPMQAIWSIGWLVTFGSLVGYTAYIYLLEHVPVAKVSTYAYINPIVAVALGTLLLHERMQPIEYLGMGAIVIAVYLVTSSRLIPAKTGAAQSEAADLETLKS